ncbi:G-protein coupled receptor Mth2-like isoform X16 [Onthophagus taurus]|uniref:G-protein coupled receptor Mth2-like isoform X16 n=1 Tax=Onthophagus taurus TaxID=166361 RepID=UPI000C20D0C4|nr:G-protein coupled receptor Mth2-like isoform X15 [Onthophagus taurus]
MKQIFAYAFIFFCSFPPLKSDLCGEKPCLKKCCQRGLELTFQENLICNYSDFDNFNVSLLPHQEDLKSYFDVIESDDIEYNLNCSDGTFQMFLSSYEDDFYLHESGNVFVTSDYIIKSFCGDVFNGENGIFYCAWMEKEDFKKIGMIISMPFLIATFLVYALLPDKNLPAKSLMCYVLSLLFAYIMLVTIQLNSNLEHGACVTIAYLCYFFFMVSFFWMNSSCIDIWLTFSGIKGITGQRTQERKRFIYYCLYSWGLPLIMTSIVVVMTMEHLKDSIFFTAIGDGQCWFKNGLSTGIYFYFPIAILLITNIVLFAITALKIRNVQRDTKVLNAKDSSKHEKDKQRIDEYNSEPCYLIEPVKNRGMQVYDFLDVDNSCLGFNLYIKLLFAMGVNWSMEVISWLVQWQSNNVPTYIWYITDFCNAMYGVLIFFIFVFKKNIWIMLKKRYLQIMGRSTRAHSMGTSTHRTTLFTAISLQSIPGAGLLTKMHSTPNDNRNELRPPKIH